MNDRLLNLAASLLTGDGQHGRVLWRTGAATCHLRYDGDVAELRITSSSNSRRRDYIVRCPIDVEAIR